MNIDNINYQDGEWKEDERVGLVKAPSPNFPGVIQTFSEEN